MHKKQSIECWIIDTDKQLALLLRVPTKDGVEAYNQPITGGIENGETPEMGCIREVFEETGHTIKTENLTFLRGDFKVVVGDFMELNKFVYCYTASKFEVKLSPTEHESYKWVPLTKVEAELTYPSNVQTLKWALDFYESPGEGRS